MSTPEIKTIVNNINRLMQGMPIKELAKKSGIPYSTLSPLLKGDRSFAIERIIQIAGALNVDMNTLLDGTYSISKKTDDKQQSKPSRYQVSFLTNNRTSRCAIKDLGDNTIQSALFPRPIFTTENAYNTINILKDAIKQILKEPNIDFREISVYASALSFEHIHGRDALINEGKKHFLNFILEPDWKPTFNALYPNENGILITVNDGIAISYTYDNGKTFNKHQGYIPASEKAGSIWLGCEAVRHAINVVEGIDSRTRLSDQVLSMFYSDLEMLATEVFDNPRDVYRKITTIIRTLAPQKEKSFQLIQDSFNQLWEHVKALDKKLDKELPVKISGDLADTYAEFIPKNRFAGSDFQKEEDELSYAFSVLARQEKPKASS